MFVKFVIFSCAFVACIATTKQGVAPLPSTTTTAATPGVYCGETPGNILACLENPKVISKDVAKKCNRRLSPCDSKKCIFRESGWASTDDKVNKQKVAEYFNQYAIDHPEWSAAVQHLKATCLDKDLPPQGAIQECPAYDVLHCIFISFLRNATPSQWRAVPECAPAQTFAAACPVCPTECFAQFVPYGTCNACLSLPRTP